MPQICPYVRFGITDHTIGRAECTPNARFISRIARSCSFCRCEPSAMGPIGRPTYLARSTCICAHTRARTETVRPNLTKVFYESCWQENTNVGYENALSPRCRQFTILQFAEYARLVQTIEKRCMYRGQRHTRIGSVHTKADLRRSNYGGIHIMCVPRAVGGRANTANLLWRPRCSSFTDTDPISTRNPRAEIDGVYQTRRRIRRITARAISRNKISAGE